MEEHIFDILGIGSKEDCYTSLIALALTHKPEYRRNLLAVLGESDYGDWQVEPWPHVKIVSSSGRQEDIPDLVLFSQTANKILLIENKIFSGEGWKQTERYARSEFKDSLKKKIVMERPDFKFYYLSLDGIRPSSSDFQLLSFLDVVRAIPEKLGASKLDLLMEEMRQRIEEYYNWPAPNEEDIVLDYFKRTSRLVNWYRTFKIVLDNILQERKLFSKEYSYTSHPGAGFIPLCLWFKKPWRSREYPDEQDGSKCFDIHFEFQWDTRWDSLRLFLHYHVSPYRTVKEIEGIEKSNPHFVSGYKDKRSKCFAYIKKNAPDGWTLRNTPLSMASWNFEKGIKFGELKKRLNLLVDNMMPIVDEFRKVP